MKHEARRVVTGHDEQGQSVVLSDAVVEAFEAAPAFANRIWSTDSFPTDNADQRDGAVVIETLPSNDGSAFYVVDWAPNSEFPEHRTLTVDYGVVLSGVLEVVLDSGQSTRLYPGDTIVQRGAAHTWVNPTDEWTRTAFVMVGSKPLLVNGEEVQPTM
ncbi:cupin domain-containing protein [Gordonia sp. TBRC 11910]|uniref:Cupin domain-containing protein n=1 Tax=Gordonia asplenii TaxID=2725283 RepID=A0A848KXL4_9ACTN|nr:cupin domain-containing protein [Gordonia asplenii]NMO03079.1 cupin domain-containing protein [Gordonia asplenii]